MKTTEKKSFNVRGFVTLTIAVTGLGLPVSGLANHLLQSEPLLRLSRHAWMSAHNTLGILFVVFGVWHAVLNRRALFNYLRALTTGGSSGGREGVSAIALVVLILFVVVSHAFHFH
jgi:hypothetical protein